MTRQTHCPTSHKRLTVLRVARIPMETRSFRASKAWDDAIATADAAGENFADRLREYVDWYSRQPGARAPRRPPKAVRAEAVHHDDDTASG